MTSSLEIRHLSIANKGRPMFSLNELVKGGEVLTVMGPSGSGKSTLLSWITGMLDNNFKATGSLCLNGLDISNTVPYLRGIGLLYQDPLLFDHLSVEGNIAFGMNNTSGELKSKLINDGLASFSLDGMNKRAPSSLSGGQKARVALLRLLLNEPKAILLDEPFSSLDSQLRVETRELVFSEIKKRSLPAILVTHDEVDAAAANGKVVQLGN